MGLSNKKSTSQTNSASTATTTKDVPAWLQDTTQGINTAIAKLGQADPLSFIPKTNGAQSTALGMATDFAGSKNKDLEDAAAAYRGAGSVSAATLLDGLDKYYNPYKDQVLNPLMADADAQAGQIRAQLAASGARNGAFGGSRFGVREGQTEGELARARASTLGAALNDMFSTATSLSSQDAQRRQDASAANAGLDLQRAAGLAGVGQAKDQSMMDRIGLLSGLGDAQYGRDQTTAQAPLDLLKTQVGLLQGLNPSDYIGATVNETGNSRTTNKTMSSLGEDLGNIAKVAALFI